MTNTMRWVIILTALSVSGPSAIAQSYALYRINADGTDFRKIIQLDQTVERINDLSVSPDGKLLALSLFENKHAKIFIIGSDGTNLREITNDNSADSSGASFVDDGHKILFDSFAQDGQTNLYSMSLDGSAKTLFMKNGASARMSSDATKIVLLRTQDPVTSSISSAIKVVVCNSDSSASKSITGDQLIWDPHPSFNPKNSGELLLTEFKDARSPTVLELVDVRQLNRKVLVKSDNLGVGSSFSPTGNIIVYSATGDIVPSNGAGKRFDIYKINNDGSGVQKLTSAGTTATFYLPVFDPNGKTIIFAGTEMRH